MCPTRQARLHVCVSEDLADGAHIKFPVSHDGQPASVIVFRLNGRAGAFKNWCVHMPRTLDCEEDMVFDKTGRYLRCSMHGIVYDPVSGESLSEICRGERLTEVKVEEDEAGVWIADRHVDAAPDATGTAPPVPAGKDGA